MEFSRRMVAVIMLLMLHLSLVTAQFHSYDDVSSRPRKPGSSSGASRPKKPGSSSGATRQRKPTHLAPFTDARGCINFLQDLSSCWSSRCQASCVSRSEGYIGWELVSSECFYNMCKCVMCRSQQPAESPNESKISITVDQEGCTRYAMPMPDCRPYNCRRSCNTKKRYFHPGWSIVSKHCNAPHGTVCHCKLCPPAPSAESPNEYMISVTTDARGCTQYTHRLTGWPQNNCPTLCQTIINYHPGCYIESNESNSDHTICRCEVCPNPQPASLPTLACSAGSYLPHATGYSGGGHGMGGGEL
ncbi:hypothetical protein KSP40_PGU002459 [Platanthera guangdongensis]|uniref:Uncharacterized protein n=1 Tax=Platanthera guangdongensis TaxID=2320717 RepID=A0ABR2LQL7_9ASPA